MVVTVDFRNCHLAAHIMSKGLPDGSELLAVAAPKASYVAIYFRPLSNAKNPHKIRTKEQRT